MARRIAAASALFVFAASLLLGLRAENTFATTLSRALIAMAATFMVGLVIGAMADRMLAENLSIAAKKVEDSEAKTSVEDR
jgi:hypothetical protein